MASQQQSARRRRTAGWYKLAKALSATAAFACLAFASTPTVDSANYDACLAYTNEHNRAPDVVICSWDNYDEIHAGDTAVSGSFGGAKGELGHTIIVDIDNVTTTSGKARFQTTPNGHVFQSIDDTVDTCGDGLVMPFFIAEGSWSQAFRLILYLVGMLWCFLGIAIIADEFMAAIEVITSQEKKVTVKDPTTGKTSTVTVLVWNETVANLTLMALGSSAPEILLAVIETVTSLGEPPSDGLGPGTIVGSAAFNLLIIVGICVVSIPKGEKRKIKELGVFTVTAFFSVFAYVWMLFVLQWNTENVVDFSEAIITFMFFPLLVCLAYAQDRNWWRKTGAVQPTAAWQVGTGGMGAHGYGAEDVARLLHDQDPDALSQLDEETLAKLATNEIMAHKRRTIATHRVQAGRALTGASRVYVPRNSLVTLSQVGHDKAAAAAAAGHSVRDLHGDGDGESKGTPTDTAVLSFGSPTYACLEDCGTIELIVIRTGDTSQEVRVMYETSNGTATAGADYTYTSGELKFAPGDDVHKIVIPIVDDNEFEPDETFYCTLRLPAGAHANTAAVGLGKFPVTEVTIINDDDPGEFEFEKASYNVKESDGSVEVAMLRKNGSDGEVKVLVSSVDTPTGAVAGADYEGVHDKELTFEHGETRKTFSITIKDDGDYEKDESFTLEFKIVGFPECGAKYADGNRQAVVTITNDEEFAKMVDKVALLINLNMDRMAINTTTWKEQIQRAMHVAGDEEDSEPTGADYVMHFMSFFWKVVFSLTPPTSIANGWAAFSVALIFIGLVTAVVGDLASTFGCLLGLNDAVTAITFVALGTSLPDTFASKAAAVNDDNADASIGNVTGSNSVNVFLGLGLPWVIATLYHMANGTVYEVKAGDLSFSVLLFCICAVVCILFIYIRRIPAVEGAELGGSVTLKWATAVFFFLLWMVYIILSSLNSLGKL